MMMMMMMMLTLLMLKLDDVMLKLALVWWRERQFVRSNTEAKPQMDDILRPERV